MVDGLFKWIGHYQDHHNKLSFLFALTSRCVREVALRLIDFFCEIGASSILQIGNGRAFVALVISELK